MKERGLGSEMEKCGEESWSNSQFKWWTALKTQFIIYCDISSCLHFVFSQGRYFRFYILYFLVGGWGEGRRSVTGMSTDCRKPPGDGDWKWRSRWSRELLILPLTSPGLAVRDAPDSFSTLLKIGSGWGSNSLCAEQNRFIAIFLP